MYNFEDKKAIAYANSFPDIYIYNENYIPFSLLFNLNNTNIQSMKDYFIHAKNYYRKIASVEEIEKQLKIWIDDVPLCPVIYRSWERHAVSKFYEIINTTLYFDKTRFRIGKNYIKGYYSLFNDKFTEGYFVLVVKKEYTKYVKLAILTGEPILEDCFEFWYDLTLINKDIRLKKVTKKIMKELESIDVPCINKSGILDLLQLVIEFKAPTISKQKELINNFVGEFQQYQREEINPSLIPKQTLIKDSQTLAFGQTLPF